MPRTADRFSCNLNEKRKNHSGFYTTYGQDFLTWQKLNF